jgi:hypothetical protein
MIDLQPDRLGLIARLDLIEVEDGAVAPVDYKRGAGPMSPPAPGTPSACSSACRA